MLRYAITDLGHTSSQPAARRELLQAAVRRWTAAGVDFIQLREKSLGAGEVFSLAREIAQQLQETGTQTRLLINGRADLALAAGAHGVHLTAAPGELTPMQVRALFAKQGKTAVISISCHTPDEAEQASRMGPDLLLFGPVFEKVVGGTLVLKGSGLGLLSRAAKLSGATPVLALGGVTPENTAACLSHGAAGVAGIRLFG